MWVDARRAKIIRSSLVSCCGNECGEEEEEEEEIVLLVFGELDDWLG